MSTNLTVKGQVTVPKSVREYLGLKAGSAVTFERLPSGEVVLRPAKKRAKTSNTRFAKLRGRATVRMKTQEIMALTRGTKG
jgi:AbrB family looped-hinge helix DNA binding protein